MQLKKRNSVKYCKQYQVTVFLILTPCKQNKLFARFYFGVRKVNVGIMTYEFLY